MLHLDADRLAALADELPTVPEAEHLAACAVCAHEVDAYRGLRSAGARTGGVVLDAPLTSWESLAPALIDAGVMRAPGIAAVRAPLRAQWRPWMGVAAAALLAVGGVIAGRMSVTTSATGRASMAANDLPPAGVQNAGLNTSDGKQIVSIDDALNVMARAERDYRAAAAFIASHDTTTRGDAERYRLRLAALERVEDAARQAVNTSPDDPILNQYLASTRSAHTVTLQQLGNALPPGYKLTRW